MKHSELKRHTPLQRTGSLKNSKPMSKRRSKRARSREFSPEVKLIVWERSCGTCERCDRKEIMAYHHCTFRSQGGTGELENCLGLCLWCHTEDDDSAHKSRETRLWCARRAKKLATEQAEVS